MAVRTERSEVRTKTTEGQYSPVRLELARLVSSLLYGTRTVLVLSLPAFENKKYTAYDRFHGNGPYGEIPTEKEPIRTLGFTLPYNKYGLLTKCEVKMAGCWPSSFFACLWTWTESRSINLQKKERGQYPAILTKQTWSIKDLLCGFWLNFYCGTRWVVPRGQDSSILPTQVANQSAGFDSSCLLMELAIK